jgi:hypothetical protein
MACLMARHRSSPSLTRPLRPVDRSDTHATRSWHEADQQSVEFLGGDTIVAWETIAFLSERIPTARQPAAER